jgi:hypothetical protein
VSDITKVLVAITGVALLSVLVVNGTQSAAVIKSTGDAFSNSLTAAEKG